MCVLRDLADTFDDITRVSCDSVDTTDDMYVLEND